MTSSGGVIQHLVRLEDVSIEVPGTHGLDGGLGKSGWVLLGEEYTGEIWGSLRETRLYLLAHPPLTAAIDQHEVTECPQVCPTHPREATGAGASS